MTDYDFYRNSYLGSDIPEETFDILAKRAQAHLESFRRRYCVLPCDKVSEQMAVCAMAETLYENGGRGIASASVGEVSVHYDTGKSLNRQLLDKARIYLELYRGASQ